MIAWRQKLGGINFSRRLKLGKEYFRLYCPWRDPIAAACAHHTSHSFQPRLKIPELRFAESASLTFQSWKLCCDSRFQHVFTACSCVFTFDENASIDVYLQCNLYHSIPLKYTNVDINAGSKLKTLRFEFSIETFLSAENSTVWVFKLWNHTSMRKTHA